jgi:hypothetical protein
VSDYLSNLATRSLNPTVEIQPRLASLFEPPHPTGGPVSGHAFGLETVDGEPASGETTFDAPSPAQPPVGLPVASPPVTSLRPPSDVGQQQSGNLSAIPGWLPSQPAPGPVPPQRPMPVLPTAAAQPSTTRAPGQPDPDRPTLTPAPARDESGAPPPRGAAEGAPQPALEPAIQQIVIERIVTPEERRPASAGDETGAVPLGSAAKRQHRPTLEPAIQQIVVERVIGSAVPPPTGAASAETEAAASRSTDEREGRTALEPAIEATRPSTPAAVVAQPHVTLLH